MGYKIDGKAVSKPWHTVLIEYRRRSKHRFTVNSGRRTMREQWALYRAYKAGTGNLAAYPLPSAPHINYGRANHAIDVNALDGGAERLVRWLRRNGVNATRPIASEAWHVVAPRNDLLALAARIERDRKKTKR